MQRDEIQTLVRRQREYFYSGETQKLSFRREQLKKLYSYISDHEEEIGEAIRQDLGKSPFESYMCEIGMVLGEITYMLKHLNSLAREKRVPTPLAQFHSRSYRKPSPCGVILIMSPWNYPFLLTIEPLVDAMAAGNTVIMKPSAYSPATSDWIRRMAEECFEDRYVTLITGGREENTALLEEHFDKIFFTGSQQVGKEVMRKAAEHLTPVTLELGGKSPVIVDAKANIPLAAKRIVWGKYLNCGQTCVAPDYVLCHSDVVEDLLREMKRQVRRQFGKNPLKNPDYGKIVNQKHFDRILGLIDPEKIFLGGKYDTDTLQIEPTILRDVNRQDAVMSMEIFGPVLPVLTYESLDLEIEKINAGSHPLAFYCFTEDKKLADEMMTRIAFGGGCINDTIIHLATSEMPFGGFGESGMGGYHGKVGFENFSHYKSIVDKKTWIDLPMRYQPFRGIYNRLIHIFLH